MGRICIRGAGTILQALHLSLFQTHGSYFIYPGLQHGQSKGLSKFFYGFFIWQPNNGHVVFHLCSWNCLVILRNAIWTWLRPFTKFLILLEKKFEIVTLCLLKLFEYARCFIVLSLKLYESMDSLWFGLEISWVEFCKVWVLQHGQSKAHHSRLVYMV